MSYSLEAVDRELRRAFAAAAGATVRAGETPSSIEEGMLLRSPSGGVFRVVETLEIAGTDRARLRWDGGELVLHVTDMLRAGWTLAEEVERGVR